MIRFVCSDCNATHSKWSGHCHACGAWNTIVEDTGSKRKKTNKNIFQNTHETNIERVQTKIEEFDRVCGGGLVPGSIILIGGNPGIGKSTLTLQILSALSKKHTCAYVSGEESTAQIQLRAQRLNVDKDDFLMTTETNVLDLVSSLEQIKDLKIVIIDSIQTMQNPEIESYPGSIAQIRSVSSILMESAKKKNYIVILIGHVTKEGLIAGPKILEHMVDTVLYFDNDPQGDFRILRTTKNRFGNTNEIGIFSMTVEGLQEIRNPSILFLSNKEEQAVSGTAICAGIEGTRPILYEIQALVTSSFLASPRRVSVGTDSNRLSMLVAVLQSRCRLPFGQKDIYLNISGGLKISETAADLAIVAALISALKNKPNPKETVYFGEVSLSGKIRNVNASDQRIKEAKKLGYKKAFCNNEPDSFIKAVTHIQNLI